MARHMRRYLTLEVWIALMIVMALALMLRAIIGH